MDQRCSCSRMMRVKFTGCVRVSKAVARSLQLLYRLHTCADAIYSTQHVCGQRQELMCKILLRRSMPISCRLVLILLPVLGLYMYLPALCSAKRHLQDDLYKGDQTPRSLQTTAAGPKIYMYNLPEKFHNFKEIGDVSDSFYGLDQLFPELLRDSPYATNSTNDADYFYVDAWMYWPRQNIEELLKELQQIGPFWDKKQGADHLFVVTADPGRCEYPDSFLKNSIFIHHFGRLFPSEFRECNLFNMWGAACDGEMMAAEAALLKRPFKSCHFPEHDIVVPPTCYEPHPSDTKKHTWEFKTPYIHKELIMNRTDLIFYSGKIDLDADKPHAKQAPWSDAGYSFGARQTVYRMFHNVSGFKIMDHHTHTTYWHHLSSSVFCLAAAGWGWGGRMKVAVTRGCIPVIIQDGIKVEFEEQLPMQDYAIRVPMYMVHKLPDILHVFINTGRVEQMQKNLECAWRLHWWRRPEGRAFELVMCELKRRKLGASKINVDWGACTLDCGDGNLVRLLDGINNV